MIYVKFEIVRVIDIKIIHINLKNWSAQTEINIISELEQMYPSPPC